MGPKTEQGKRATRLSALKHGLLVKEVVIQTGERKEKPAEKAHGRKGRKDPRGLGPRLERKADHRPPGRAQGIGGGHRPS